MFRGAGPALDEVVHQAYVQVDESGTEAAAATGGIMVTSMPPSFEADPPFLFLIRERAPGTVLFMGRMANPKAGA